jgi:hypothetical protein
MLITMVTSLLSLARPALTFQPRGGRLAMITEVHAVC